MNPEFVRNPYNYDSDQLSEETGLECLDESLTEQEHIQEADINYIADQFMRTGEMPQIHQLPTSGDFDEIFDFQSAMNLIADAKRQFMMYPAKIRTRFENDPGQMISFVENPDNYEEAVRLGLIEKRATIQTPTTGEPNGQDPQRRTTGSSEEETRPGRAQRNATENARAQEPGAQAPQSDRGRDR